DRQQHALPPQAPEDKNPPAVTPENGRENADPKRTEEEAVTISGRVVDPDGKPFAGVKLYLWTNTVKKHADMPVRAMTEEDGRFRVTVTATEREQQAKVMAIARGYGPDWAEVTPAQKEEVTLRLVKDDVPVSGRVLDLEGRPIAGATVEVGRLEQGKDDDLKPFLENVSRGRFAYFKDISSNALEGPTSVTTDKE